MERFRSVFSMENLMGVVFFVIDKIRLVVFELAVSGRPDKDKNKYSWPDFARIRLLYAAVFLWWPAPMFDMFSHLRTSADYYALGHAFALVYLALLFLDDKHGTKKEGFVPLIVLVQHFVENSNLLPEMFSQGLVVLGAAIAGLIYLRIYEPRQLRPRRTTVPEPQLDTIPDVPTEPVAAVVPVQAEDASSFPESIIDPTKDPALRKALVAIRKAAGLPEELGIKDLFQHLIDHFFVTPDEPGQATKDLAHDLEGSDREDILRDIREALPFAVAS